MSLAKEVIKSFKEEGNEEVVDRMIVKFSNILKKEFAGDKDGMIRALWTALGDVAETSPKNLQIVQTALENAIVPED